VVVGFAVLVGGVDGVVVGFAGSRGGVGCGGWGWWGGGGVEEGCGGGEEVGVGVGEVAGWEGCGGELGDEVEGCGGDVLGMNGGVSDGVGWDGGHDGVAGGG
jgi:hypothetical protein